MANFWHWPDCGVWTLQKTGYILQLIYISIYIAEYNFNLILLTCLIFLAKIGHWKELSYVVLYFENVKGLRRSGSGLQNLYPGHWVKNGSTLSIGGGTFCTKTSCKWKENEGHCIQEAEEMAPVSNKWWKG